MNTSILKTQKKKELGTKITGSNSLKSKGIEDKTSDILLNPKRMINFAQNLTENGKQHHIYND